MMSRLLSPTHHQFRWFVRYEGSPPRGFLCARIFGGCFMQPPIRFTGDPKLDLIIFIVGFFVLLYLLLTFCLSGVWARPRLCHTVIVFLKWKREKRSRYIEKATKRAVIARDLKGEQYDSKTHHIDHVWPHSKGGSQTSDNLRVIPKKKNLQKGAKRPGLRDMF